MTKYYDEESALQHLVKYPSDIFYCKSTATLVSCSLHVVNGDPIVFADNGLKLDLNRCSERNDWELVTKTYTTIQAMTMLLTDKTLRFVAPETLDYREEKLSLDNHGDFVFYCLYPDAEFEPNGSATILNRSDWRIERD